MRPVNGLRVGDYFERDGERLLVLSVNPALGEVVLKPVSSASETMSAAQLNAYVESEELVFVERGTGKRVDELVNALNSGKLSALSKAGYAYREQVVEHVEHLISQGTTALEAYVVASTLKPEHDLVEAVSARTVRRWFAAYRANGKIALIPKHSAKSRKKTELSHEQHSLIVEVVTAHEKVAKLMLKDLWEKVNRTLVHSGLNNDGKQISYHRVREVLLNMPWVQKYASKFNPKVQRAIRSFGVQSYQVRGVFERVEMDYCKLPLFIIPFPGAQPAEVWAALAIDVASGHLLAVEAFLRPPNAIDALKTVERACYGLSEEVFTNFQIQNRLSVCGSISEIVVDNGSEFRNESFSKLTTLGFGVTFTPGYSPYRKPFVERAVGAVKKFAGTLVGSTVNSADKHADETERAMGEARMLFSELQAALYQFVYDKYALREIKRHILSSVLFDPNHGITPAQRIESSLRTDLPLPPPSHEMFRKSRLVSHKRTLQKSGIEFQTLNYSSESLRDLYHLIGPSTQANKSEKMLTILVDPLDVRSIYVEHPRTKEHLLAHLMCGTSERLEMGMSFEQFSDARAYALEVFRSSGAKEIQDAHRIRVQDDQDMMRQRTGPSRAKKKERRESVRNLSIAKDAYNTPPLSEPIEVNGQTKLLASESMGNEDLSDLEGVQRVGRPKR